MGDDPSSNSSETYLQSWVQSWAPQYMRNVHTGVSPVKSHKDDKGPGASDMGGEDEGAGTVQPR